MEKIGQSGGAWESDDVISEARMQQKTITAHDSVSGLTTYPGMHWVDTGLTETTMKIRNASNDAWILVKPTSVFWKDHMLGANASDGQVDRHPAVELADAVAAAIVHYGGILPNDYTALCSGYPVLVCSAVATSGNVRLIISTTAAADGEATDSATDSIAEYTQAITSARTDVDISAAFDGLSLVAGDMVGVSIERDSDDASDSLTEDFMTYGILVKYY